MDTELLKVGSNIFRRQILIEFHSNSLSWKYLIYLSNENLFQSFWKQNKNYWSKGWKPGALNQGFVRQFFEWWLKEAVTCHQEILKLGLLLV